MAKGTIEKVKKGKPTHFLILPKLPTFVRKQSVMPTASNSSSTLPTQPIFTQMVVLVFLIFFGTFMASQLVSVLEGYYGLTYSELIRNLEKDSPLDEKNFLKISLGISHCFTFILPALVFLWLHHRSDGWKAVQLNRFPAILYGLLSGLLLLLAFPFVQFIFQLNKQLPLPEWAIQQENLINQTLEHLLYVQSPSELLVNIFIMGLLPAIGEELLFRGIIQQKLETISKNPTLAIWSTALLFSFIHFQFQGFFPRVLLGAVLGYLLVWSRNLWIPIIAHFIYNSGQVILQYLNQQGLWGINLNEIEQVPIGLVFGSIFTSLGMGYFLWKSFTQRIIWENPS